MTKLDKLPSRPSDSRRGTTEGNSTLALHLQKIQDAIEEIWKQERGGNRLSVITSEEGIESHQHTDMFFDIVTKEENGIHKDESEREVIMTEFSTDKITIIPTSSRQKIGLYQLWKQILTMFETSQ